ncbi:MAG: cyclic nucleotide-binding domain-containing protein, partial [Desulfobacterium sp.]|nr:cyclic nucleotide-binding domain-containing protein [Desulfobacterium sp.]
MTCLCKQIAGDDIELSPTCIGNLWIFENLAPDDVQALSQKALRRKMKKGETVFMQGDSADEVFLIKGGRIKLTKVLENGTELMLSRVNYFVRFASIILSGRDSVLKLNR